MYLKTRNILLTMFTALAAAVLVAAPAAAGPAGIDLGLAQQARTNGLDDAEARSLQAQVGAHLAEFGGTQTAINKIELADGGFVLLALPGETYARDVTAAPGVDAVACPFLYLCAYKGPNYTGDIIALTDCNAQPEPERIPWFTTGSYRNNQTAGTVGRFFVINDDGDEVVSRTGPAFSQVASWNWANTTAIDPC